MATTYTYTTVADDDRKYKEGDVVILKGKTGDLLPNRWSSEMRRWMGEMVTISAINYLSRIFGVKETRGYHFFFDNIERVATKEEIAEIEAAKKKKHEEAMKLVVCTPEGIRKIAKETFGEERVWLNVIERDYFKLYIHFPEIHITNSKEHKHTIKDIYAVFNISIGDITDEDDYKATIAFSGMRTTYSIKEHSCHYAHSHLPNCRGVEEHGFCLGSSTFGMLLSNLSQSLSEEDWNMMLLSLENYLNWESLEGGPYKQISQLKLQSGIGVENIKTELYKLINDIPRDIWIISNEGRVIESHPSLVKFLDEKFPIRKMNEINKDTMDRLVKNAKRSINGKNAFKWKEEIRKCIILPEEPDKPENIPHVDAQIVRIVEDILNLEFNTFLKTFQHERQRKKQRERVFPSSFISIGEIGALK